MDNKFVLIGSNNDEKILAMKSREFTWKDARIDLVRPSDNLIAALNAIRLSEECDTPILRETDEKTNRQ